MNRVRHQWTEINGVTVLRGVVPLPLSLVKRVTERIARGLIAYFHPDLAVHKLHCNTFIPNRETLWEVFASIGDDLQELRLGGRSFHAYHGVVADMPTSGVILMTFHETIASAVFHFDKEELQKYQNREADRAEGNQLDL